MELVIKIRMDNAAFEDPMEVARILKDVIASWYGLFPGVIRPLRDSNGNAIGSATIEE